MEREARADREERVREQSERYGRQFCTRHARVVGEEVAAFLHGASRVADRTIEVRVYSRYTRAMNTVTLRTILEHVPTDATRSPADLHVTEFGQVVLSETLCVSAQIYAIVVAAWVASLHHEVRPRVDSGEADAAHIERTRAALTRE